MADDRASHWVSTIPEIFYDLIARVLPGAVAWMVAADQYLSFRTWIEQRPRGLTWNATGAAAVVAALVALAACWVVGFLLTPLGDHAWRGLRSEEIFLNVVRQHGRLLQQAAERGIIDQEREPGLWAAGYDESRRKELCALSGVMYQQIHEYLKDRREVWRGVLTKNQAEVTFYANVTGTMRLLLLATIPLVLCACYVMTIHPVALGMRPWLGFLLTGVAPAGVLCWTAHKGLVSKQPRLWTRHIACLTVDLRAADQVVPGVEMNRRAELIGD